MISKIQYNTKFFLFNGSNFIRFSNFDRHKPYSIDTALYISNKSYSHSFKYVLDLYYNRVLDLNTKTDTYSYRINHQLYE